MSVRRVAVVTLGCGRNDADSEELAGRLSAEGWHIVADPAHADAVLVNTCGFIEAAKKDSIDTVLATADTGRPVVAVGCLAERYGDQLAESLPEAAAVLSFDDYPQIGQRLDDVLAGRPIPAHRPRDRRMLLPLAPVDRQAVLPTAGEGGEPGAEAQLARQRLDDGPVAPLKLASGCDRRCTFCAIPTFRGAFVSRRPNDVLAEAHWLAERGVRELVLVSENSTSYGKDLGDPRLLEVLLPELAAVPGIVRVRVCYLQPAELRPSLVAVLASTPGVAAYFDLSFQHASAAVLRRMRRFGDGAQFTALVETIREQAPDAGIRSNVIVGFPGETAADLGEVERFLIAARLDAVGVFGYSDEDGTAAAGLPGKVRGPTIARRLDRMSRLAEELTAQRAQERVGADLEVLIESVDERAGTAEGRAAHQAPEVDGTTVVHAQTSLGVGDLVLARVTDSVGVDLIADAVAVLGQAPRRPGAAPAPVPA